MLQWLTCLLSPLPTLPTPAKLIIYVGSWYSNTGFCVCTTDTLLTEPSSSSCLFVYIVKSLIMYIYYIFCISLSFKVPNSDVYQEGSCLSVFSLYNDYFKLHFGINVSVLFPPLKSLPIFVSFPFLSFFFLRLYWEGGEQNEGERAPVCHGKCLYLQRDFPVSSFS